MTPFDTMHARARDVGRRTWFRETLAGFGMLLFLAVALMVLAI